MKYRKRPVVIDAVQFTGDNYDEIKAALDELGGEAAPLSFNAREHHVSVLTTDGIMTVLAGDWIIRGVDGALYPCKPADFDEAYDVVPEGAPEPDPVADRPPTRRRGW